MERKKLGAISIILIIFTFNFLIFQQTNINFSQEKYQLDTPEANSDINLLIYEWDSQITRAVGQTPLSIASGDVNNDGEIDMVIANNNSDSITIFLWNITKGDWDVQNQSVGNAPRAVAVGDLDHDSYNDIVVVNTASDDITLLIWNETNNNWDSSTKGVGDQPHDVAIGDANNDGLNEIVVANYGDDNVSIFSWNVTGGGWNAEMTEPVRNGPIAIGVGDVNWDGLNEILTANALDNDISILQWNETDWYALNEFTIGSTPSNLELGDGNNDGQLDIISPLGGSNSVMFITWNVSTTTWDFTVKGVSTNPSSIAVGDVNGDGQNDLIAANYGAANISMLLWNISTNDWDITTKSVGTGPTSVIIDDVNNDGLPEIVAANSGDNNITILLWNTTLGALTPGRVTRSVGDRPIGVAVGDANNDGELDIVSANSNEKTVSVLTWNETLNDWNPVVNLAVNISPTSVVIGDANNDGVQDIVACSSNATDPFSKNVSILLWNKQTNTWNPYITRYLVSWSCDDVVVADVNNDGANDIIVAAHFSAGSIYTLIWNKTINDWNPSTSLAVTSLAHDVEIADVNNDGFNDVIAAGNSSSNKYYYIRLWNSSNGNWESDPLYTLSTTSAIFTPAIKVGDANNDGLNDLVLTDMEFDNVTIFCWNDTIDTWNPPVYEDVSDDPISVNIGDVNNDGQNDIVTANIGGTAKISVLLWNGTNGDWETQVDYGGGSQPRSAVIGDVTGDGMNDITFSNLPNDRVSIIQYNRFPLILTKTVIQSNANWTQDEDFGSFSIDLTAFEIDAEDNHANLTWFPFDLDTSLVTVSGNFSANDVLTFSSVENQNGIDTFELRLRDQHNFQDSVTITITINSINDDPVILSRAQLQASSTWSPSMDSGAVIIDLTPYESDVEDSGAALDWFVIGLDPQIATVTGQNSSVDVLTFHPQGSGSDTFQLVLIDSDGGTDVIIITLSVGPSLILILSIVIPLAVVGAMVAFYFIYWRRRKPAKKTTLKRKKL